MCAAAFFLKKRTGMIEINLYEVAGFVSALKALHLPFGKGCESFADAETVKGNDDLIGTWHVNIFAKDEKLLRTLIAAGDEHAKVIRGVVAYLEINAPRYWWAEMDTYRIGREQLSSESTMHIQGKGLKEEELVKMKSELPEGTMQKRVVMLSYQTIRRIISQRRNHRLPEWREFCRWAIDYLPYSWILE